MKLQLPSVTLVIVDCVEVERAVRVINRCKALCDFGAIKFLTSLPSDNEHRVEIQHLPTLTHYSHFCLKKLHQYIDTQHLLIVQRDGWILNPGTWDNEWLKYDYIGSLFNEFDVNGNGGFSFRSKALIKAAVDMYPPWEETDDGTEGLQKHIGFWEDGAYSFGLRSKLEHLGFTYAPLKIASMFAQGGNPNIDYYYAYPFGFHGSWRMFDQETGFVGSEIKHDGLYPQPL